MKNQTPECGVKFHAWISSSTVGPRNVQVSRDVDRPVTIKARVIEKFFSFREASASFQADNSFFFVRAPVCFISLSFVSLSILNLVFFLGNEVRPKGTVPPIVGGVEE
jgi:hypothetical protein